MTLERCARAGVDVASLDVRDTDHGAQACSGAACVSMAQVLAVAPAPRLLLRTPVQLLDDVQAAIAQADAAARTWVEPLFERPMGSATQTIAPGVVYRREVRTAPRPMMVHIVEIELARAEFVVTAGVPQAGLEFVAEKTSAFAHRMHTTVAINATYFRPFDGGRFLAKPYVPQSGQAVEVDGVSIADGHADSQAASPDARSNGAFCTTPHGVSIVQGDCPADTAQAVGGGPVLITNGQPVPLRVKPDDARAKEIETYYRHTEPRTALGIDAARRKLWIVVVDGRQAGYSEGITLPELTALFTELGARSAINLDGGGSSTLVLGDGAGGEQLANSPIHTSIPGRERPVGNHLGVRLRSVN
ncbi:MAG: phosphodiester glycosidase family protein [Betaproteobacteria bacterium]